MPTPKNKVRKVKGWAYVSREGWLDMFHYGPLQVYGFKPAWDKEDRKSGYRAVPCVITYSLKKPK